MPDTIRLDAQSVSLVCAIELLRGNQLRIRIAIDRSQSSKAVPFVHRQLQAPKNGADDASLWNCRKNRAPRNSLDRSMTHVSLEDAAPGEVSHLQEVVILLRIVRVRPDLAVNVGEWIRRSVVRKERRASEANRPFDLRCQEIGRRSRAATLNVRDLIILGNSSGDLKHEPTVIFATGREERFQSSREWIALPIPRRFFDTDLLSSRNCRARLFVSERCPEAAFLNFPPRRAKNFFLKLCLRIYFIWSIMLIHMSLFF